MSDKKVVQYTESHFSGNPVGAGIYIKTIDHPDFDDITQREYGLRTSSVVAYDEATGFIETMNTLYVPAGTKH